MHGVGLSCSAVLLMKTVAPSDLHALVASQIPSDLHASVASRFVRTFHTLGANAHTSLSPVVKKPKRIGYQRPTRRAYGSRTEGVGVAYR